MVRGKPRKEVFLGKLYEAYVKLCKQRRLKFEKLVAVHYLCVLSGEDRIIQDEH